MGKKTAIAWCHSTFNPWWGCTNVGPGCDACYAEVFAHRLGYGWGAGTPRRYFGDKHWNEPLNWNKRADPGKPWYVFCASMADVFDNEVPQEHRERLWNLIEATPRLTWLLVTKRIVNVASMFPERWKEDGAPINVWLLATMVNQMEVNRDLGRLVAMGKAGYVSTLGISVEPMLERIVFPDAMADIDWAIFGGESKQGSHAPRPCDATWIADGVEQCRKLGVTPFVKQLGSNAYVNGVDLLMADRAGADPAEWPKNLQVQEWPRTVRLPSAFPKYTKCPHCGSLYCGPLRCRFSMEPI